MKTVNMHEAKTHLSRLVQAAADGEPFIIARDGVPLAKVVPLNTPAPRPIQRLGFLEGQFAIPDTVEEFNNMYAKEIEEMFYGEDPA